MTRAPRLTTALRAALASLILATAASPSLAQTPETIKVASPPVDVAGNLFYALDLGYFAKAGLDVQISQLSAGAPVVAAVLGGAVDMGSSNLLPIAAAHQSGFSVVLVGPSGANSSKSPIDAVIVAKDSPIKTAKDLNGKTCVTSALLNILQIQASAWMDKNGGDWKSVKWVDAPPASEAATVASGRVDCAAITEPFLSAALAAGDVRLLTYTGAEIAPLVFEGGLFTSVAYAAKHVDMLKKFNRAVIDAGVWANTHHDEAALILAKYSKRDPAKVANHAVFPENFRAADLQPLLDAAAKYGAIKSTFPASELVQR
jgi:NitT/TauT family transport system substrate-binding protein